MLADKGATSPLHSEKVQTILNIVLGSEGPLHEKLNDALECLASEDILLDLLTDPTFSMDPIIEALSSYFVPTSSRLGSGTFSKYANFYLAILSKLDQLAQNGQLALISSITACIHYFKFNHKEDDCSEFKKSLSNVIEVYRTIFKASAKAASVANLKLFAERHWCVDEVEIFFICRQFLKLLPAFEKVPELGLPYMKLISKCIKNENSLKLLNDAVMLIHIMMRKFMKIPQYPDMISMLNCTFESLKLINNKQNTNVPEIANQIQKLLGEIFSFLREHSVYLDALIQEDSFNDFNISFFRSINLEANLHLVPSFKKSMMKHLFAGSIGPLLIEKSDSSSFYEIYFKLAFGDFRDLSLDHENVFSNEVFQYDLIANLLLTGNNQNMIDQLLMNCSKGYFLSDTRIHARLMNTLKLLLLSFSSDGLGDLFKRLIKPSEKFTLSALILLNSFPFSLWRSLEKTPIINDLLCELLRTWNYLNVNESSIDLLAPVLSALANVIEESCDSLKKEDFKTIFSLLPAALSSVRNNQNTMNSIMKHKLVSSFHRVLRALLIIRDDRILDVVDSITKLGSNESSVVDSWKSISLLSFIKSNRDFSRVNKTVSDRFDMLVPKLLSYTKGMTSKGAQLSIRHFYRHSLHLYMRYAQDVNSFNKPAIQSESDALLNYVHDSSLSWSKGILDCTAEESIWAFLLTKGSNLSNSTSFVVPVQISSSLKPNYNSISSSSSVINLIKEDLTSLQHLIEDLLNRRDEASLQTLHYNLQGIIK